MIGIGIGTVIRSGASTGGMDIPPLIAKRLWGIPVSVGLYAGDFLILLLQATFSDRNQILYGIFLVCLYTLVLNQVLVSGESKTQVKIISSKYEEINEMINGEIDRGTTLLHSETGFLREQRPVILTVIANRELARLNREIQRIDPEAFLIVSPVKEARGRGFSLPRLWENKDGGKG